MHHQERKLNRKVLTCALLLCVGYIRKGEPQKLAAILEMYCLKDLLEGVLTTQHKSGIIITESTDDGRSLKLVIEITALCGSQAVISFYLSRRLSKYSARAISKDTNISSSTNVMYMVTTSPQRIEGRKRNFRSLHRREATATVWCSSGTRSTMIIIPYSTYQVKEKAHFYDKRNLY